MIDIAGLPMPADAPEAGACVRVERPEAGLCVVVLDPPHRSLAVLDLPLMRDLSKVIDDLHSTPDLRGVVFCGREPLSFAAGADIDAIESLRDPALAARVMRVGQQLFNSIEALGKRLNVALASKVQELARYRSEFFGRLRQILGNRSDVQIVGDRFVFQSEVLFTTGSADLGEPGQLQMAELAETLLQIAADIPPEVKWILQVEGHTDAIPIATARFPSNWELSSARAISVVKFLRSQGIPAERLSATGYGEFQPLDPRKDEIANRRNRRIELKLTQR